MADSVSQTPHVSVRTLRRQAGWSAIFLGAFGVHKFLLGYRSAGIVMLVIALVGWILFAVPTLMIGFVGVIEGIIYLSKSDADFAATYLQGKRVWF